MNRSRGRLAALLAWLGLSALWCALPGAGAVAPPAGADGEEPGPDPVPLRRVLLTPEQLPRELRRLREGVLERLARAEFEALVRRAAKVRGMKAAPRLLEARYHASLEDNALVGTGQWKVWHRPPGARDGERVPALLDLQPGGQPLNLALRQPRFESREALLAEFQRPGGAGARRLALLVDRAGEHTLTFEWSARSEERPEGLQVDLRLPPCPVATLELDLPGGTDPSALDGSVVSGPHPADSPGRQRWRVVCSNRAQVQLLLRRAGGAGRPAPLVLVRRQRTLQKLSPDGLDCTFTFGLDVLHQGVRELACEVDPPLRPAEVAVPGLERWDFRHGGKPGEPSLLTVRLREPLREGTLVVRCLAPLAAGTWASPGVRLAGAVPRGETLDLYVHPDLRLVGWQPGSFRLTEVGRADDPSPGPAGAGEGRRPLRRITLVGGGVGSGATSRPRRPSARLEGRGAEFRARQVAWWQVRPEGMRLTVRVTYEVSHGALFRLPVLLPAGWEVEGVDLAPGGPVRTWKVRTDPRRLDAVPPARRAAYGGVLLVELSRPLVKGAGGARPPALTVQLRRGGPGEVLGRDLPFPDAVPLGARFREGALGVEFDEQGYSATVRTPAVAEEPESEGPWGKQAPDYYYPYRGEPVTGTLRLRPRAPRVRARCTTEVFVAAGRAAVEYHLLLESESGNPDSVDLSLSADAGPAPWNWRAAPARPGGGERPGWLFGGLAGGREGAGVRAEELLPAEVAGGLAALAGRGPLGAAASLGARPPGRRWRLVLDRPLRAGEPLSLRATRQLEGPPAGGPQRWEVPLPAVLGAGNLRAAGEGAPPAPAVLAGGVDDFVGEVRVHLAGADPVRVEAHGLREAPPAPRGREDVGRRTPPAGPAWRTLRYAGAPALALEARAAGKAAGEGEPGPAGRAARVAGASLTTEWGADGVPEHRFAFRVTGWPERALMVLLPPGTRLLAAGVDGRWLEHVARDDSGPKTAVELPVPAGGGERGHAFELVYSAPPAGGALWARLEAPAPELPVEPVALRRVWRLPADTSPLHDGHFRRLPGTGLASSSGRRLRGPAELFGLSVPWLRPWPTSERLDGVRQALEDSAAGLRSGGGRTVRLARAVEEVAFRHLKGQYPLVVDSDSLRRAGLGPRSPLPVRPTTSREDRTLPWDERGLLALPALARTPGGSPTPLVVLTSRAQAERWRGASGEEEPPEALRSALGEAATFGQDSSGRFRSALTWLGGGEGVSARPLLPADGSRGAWAEWEPLAGSPNPDAVLVVRAGAVAAGGAALAALLLLGAWALRGRFGWLLAWLALAGLGVLWLPSALQALAWWPLVAGVVLALAWYLRWAARGLANPEQGAAPSAQPAGAAGGAAVAGLLLLCALTGPAGKLLRAASGKPDAPAPVFLVPGPPEEPGRQDVLVEPALLDRLRALARPALAPREEAVLVSADYGGKLVKGGAEFAATFRVEALGEGPLALALPLDGVLLRGDVLVDGARAYPVTAEPPAVGYVVDVRGRGRHKVELRFRVPVSVAGGEHGLRFTAPRVVQSRLALALPAEAAHVQAPVKFGRHRVRAEGRGKVLEVDLGAVNVPVYLRWHQGGPPVDGPGTRVEFREAYLWDLRADAGSLTALLQYRVSGGAVTALSVGLPPGLEVRSAEARRASPPGKPGPARRPPPAVRLRNWVVAGAGAGRAVRLEFAAPTSGELEVLLDLVPREPLAGSVTLPLPAPRGQPLPGVGYLAYRAEGVDARRTNWLRLTGITAADFAPFWQGAARPSPASLDYASTFRREAGAPPELRLQLRPLPARPRAAQDVTLRVGPRQAEVRATLTLSAPGKGLSLVEWEVPAALAVARVAGPNVWRWSQTDPRHLLVWLEKTTPAAQVELTGWLPLSFPGGGAPASGRPGEAFLDVPVFRVADARSSRTRLHLAATHGLDVVPVSLHRLDPLPGRPADPGRGFTTRQPDYGGRFRVRPGLRPGVRILTLAEVREGRLTFRATLDCRPRRGELRSLVVRLRNWEGDAGLKAPPGATVEARGGRGPGGDGRERAWTVRLPEGLTRPYRLHLAGSLPVKDAAGGVPMPDVMVPGARVERWVAVAGDLTAEGASGLRPVAEPTRELAEWPGEAERVRRAAGRAWEVRGGGWQVRLVARERPARPAAVRVLLAEHSAVPAGGRWLHESVYWLRQEAQAELNVSWPSAGGAGGRPVEVLGAWVDGREESSALRPEAGRLWLPLSGPAGVRRLCLRWFEREEPLDRPELAPPRLEGARPGPGVWTAYVPAGWQARSSGPALGGGADRAAALALARAAVYLEVSRDLAGGARPAEGGRLAVAQRAFSAQCLRAEQALEQGAGSGASGPGGEGPEAWLRELRDRNRDLARHEGFEKVRAEAERSARAGEAAPSPEEGPPAPVSPRGLPLSWRAGPDDPPPGLELVSARRRHERASAFGSVRWLGLLAGVWLASCSARLRRAARRLWPEVLAGAGALGWVLAGPTPVVVFLLALGAVGRLLLVAAGLRRLLARPRAGAALGGSGS